MRKPATTSTSEAVDNTERHGVVIALSEATQAAFLAWVPISSRLASARLKGAAVNLTVAAVYAPTLDAAEGAKDSFKMRSTKFLQETC